MTGSVISFADGFLIAILPVAAIVMGVALVVLKRWRLAQYAAVAELALERGRMQNALQGSSLTIWDWDVAADSIWLNANWKEMLGARAEETRGPIAHLMEHVHPDDVPRVMKAATDVLKGASQQFDEEYRVGGAKGTWIWIRSRGKVTLRDSQGRALRASGTNADITSRKLAENLLAVNEARFRALSELSSDLYWEMDEQFHLVAWSAPAWSRWSDSMLPRPELEAPELTEADWEAHRGVLEEHRPFRDLEVRQVSDDGRESWLSIGALPVNDDSGKFRGYRGLARIITDRKLAEQALRKSELQFRQLVEFMPAAIVFVNHDQRAVVHNKAYAELLGLPGYEINGQRLRDVLGEERYVEVEPYLSRALAGEPTHYTTQRSRQGGRVVDLDVLCWPLRGAGSEVEGVIVLGIDVTRLKEADRMKDHFVSVVSHELRTPLTAMRGSLGLLAGGVAGDLPEEAKPLVDIALRNSDRLWRLVDDLLDIEKMSAGHIEFQAERLDWCAALREAVESSRGLMQQFDVSFELEPLEDLHVRGDHDRLSQVLSNLILNAVKFSPAGGVVTVGARRMEGGVVRTHVRDRGPGIPASFRARIFQPFSQAETGDNRSMGGSGLGLAISREIVTRLGGSIGFDDAPGGGTTFWFDLPDSTVAQ